MGPLRCRLERQVPDHQGLAAPATDLMLDMAGLKPGSRVLDVAAGAGDQTLDIAERVGPEGSVLATDLSPQILALAAANARQSGVSWIETLVADGEFLGVPEASFDAAVCRLGLMFFPGSPQGPAEMHRALKPGGRASAMVFSTPDQQPLCCAVDGNGDEACRAASARSVPAGRSLEPRAAGTSRTPVCDGRLLRRGDDQGRRSVPAPVGGGLSGFRADFRQPRRGDSEPSRCVGTASGMGRHRFEAEKLRCMRKAGKDRTTADLRRAALAPHQRLRTAVSRA